MYLDNVTKHVVGGSIYCDDKTSARKSSFVASVTILAGCIIGGRLQGIWSYLLPAMFFISLACVVIVFKVSKYGLYLHEELWLDVVISITWVLDMSILELMCFVMARKFTPWFFLIYLPNVIVPTAFGIIIYWRLKRGNSKKRNLAASIAGGVGSGLFYTSFARGLLKGAEQSQVLMTMLMCLCFLNCLLSSFGAASLQKLYFIKKYKISK